MRAFILVAAGLLLALVGDAPANAQAKKGASAPGETVRYFQFEDFLGDLPAEGFLKETRQGTRITSAVLDVCHAVSVTSPRRDRFVVTLKAEGRRLTGSGQTQEGKQRVAVDILRKPVGKTVNFEGSIALGTEKLNVSSNGNTDMSEKEFLENQANESTLVAEPGDFTEVSPGAVGARAKREAFAAVVNAVRNENVEIGLESLAVDCAALRSGEQELQVLVDPERAPALIRKLKGLLECRLDRRRLLDRAGGAHCGRRLEGRQRRLRPGAPRLGCRRFARQEFFRLGRGQQLERHDRRVEGHPHTPEPVDLRVRAFRSHRNCSADRTGAVSFERWADCLGGRHGNRNHRHWSRAATQICEWD
jgi:hypothetical protein